MKKFWIYSTIVLWVLLGGIMLYYVNKPVSGVSNVKADYSLAGPELYSEFESNEQSANEKYLGKVIEVSGTVKEIGKDETGHASITLAVSDDMFGISCQMNEKATASSANLHKGDEIKVKGVCSGKLMDVVLVNCNVVKI